jgi:8-oxo-dGTP pyrophosphatase MutT (NUDIX family)
MAAERQAAARECFEEVRFLPFSMRHTALPGMPAATPFLARLRLAVQGNLVAPLCLSELVPVARYVTPRVEQRRFDTVFFATFFDQDQPLQELCHDRTENTSAAWIDAEDVIDGRLKIMPPQVCSLCCNKHKHKQPHGIAGQWILVHHLQRVFGAEASKSPAALQALTWPLAAVEPRLVRDVSPQPFLALWGDEHFHLEGRGPPCVARVLVV